jgi:hypothetical protein
VSITKKALSPMLWRGIVISVGKAESKKDGNEKGRRREDEPEVVVVLSLVSDDTVRVGVTEISRVSLVGGTEVRRGLVGGEVLFAAGRKGEEVRGKKRGTERTL